MRSETAQEARDFVSAGRKNLVINGAMQVAQRGTSTFTGTNVYSLDRWASISNTTDYTVQQSSTNPGYGFGNSILYTVTATKNPSGSTYASIQQRIESYVMSSLGWGTNYAKSITVSFWVRSSVPGIYTVTIKSSGGAEAFTSEYPINNANTWEYKTIYIPGPTTFTYTLGNGLGFQVEWWLAGSGTATSVLNSWTSANKNMSVNQANLHSTNGNTFYLTGVQLEVGKNATEFEHRSYGEELALCQRYYWEIGSYVTNNWAPVMLMVGNNATRAFGVMHTPVTMRAHPQITFSQCNLYNGSTSTTVTNLFRYSQTGRNSEYDGLAFEANAASGLTAGTTYRLNIENVSGTSGYIRFSAEL